MSSESTSIALKKSTVDKLNNIKLIERETYDALINRIIEERKKNE
jgi:hypothetical protein